MPERQDLGRFLGDEYSRVRSALGQRSYAKTGTIFNNAALEAERKLLLRIAESQGIDIIPQASVDPKDPSETIRSGSRDSETSSE